MKKLFLIVLIAFSSVLSAQTDEDYEVKDTLNVINKVVKIHGYKSVHYLKTDKEKIMINHCLPVMVIISKKSEFLWIVYSDGKKEKYYLNFVDKK